MEKLKSVIIYVRKQAGKKELEERDFVNVLSFKRNWVSPDAAKKLFRVCIDAKLLREENGKYVPNFEASKVILPLDFIISEEDVEKYSLEKDLFSEILDTIVASGMDRGEAIIEINSVKNELRYVTIEVAALVFCKEKGIDCTHFYRRVEEKIRSS